MIFSNETLKAMQFLAISVQEKHYDDKAVIDILSDVDDEYYAKTEFNTSSDRFAGVACKDGRLAAFSTNKQTWLYICDLRHEDQTEAVWQIYNSMNNAKTKLILENL